MHSPFIGISVDNAPDYNQLLLEFIDIPKQCPINSLLHSTANTVQRTVIRAVRSYMSGVMKFADVFFPYFVS